jgi:hypothetical protein
MANEESGGRSAEFAPRIAFLAEGGPPQRTHRAAPERKRLTGIGTVPQHVVGEEAFELRVGLAASDPPPVLVRVQVESVSHSIDRLRPLSREELASGQIVEAMPAMAEGVFEVAVTVYDEAGLTDRLAAAGVPVFRRNPVLVMFWPSVRTLRLSNGAARYDVGADKFVTETNFLFLNNTTGTVVLDGLGTRRTFDKNGNQIDTGSVNFGSSISLPPNGLSTGWWWNTGFPSGSAPYNKLKAKEEIRSTYSSKFASSATTVSSSLTWRALLGPRINIIRVGSENFSSAQNSLVDSGIAVARSIYEQVDFTIGDPIGRFHITVAQAGGLITIRNNDDAKQLTEDWTVPNDSIDVFISLDIVDASGWSPVGGPCDKNEKGMTGSVIDIEGSSAYFGNSVAHELGHYMGLNHVSDPDNFIGNNGDSDSKTGITVAQYDTMKQHCFVRDLG